ncbi:MAG TPA: DUF1194 domain-containing protein [Kiloniellaceae bacterium]|nr:DUF1194 domain-containing protein [Kiloniellaceae bacterium]
MCRRFLRLTGLALISSLFLCGFSLQGKAATQVSLELVLAVDCSSSVDQGEFELQMRGLAEAFRHPSVLNALQQTWPKGIAVALLQWSGDNDQIRALDWTHVNSAPAAAAFADSLDKTPRFVDGGPTALGNAVNVAVDWILGNGFDGERQVIDVSGDGRANTGDAAAVARHYANERGITVNGLAILNEEPKLASYYLAGVVGGPGAFLLTADDFEDFSRAIRRKIFFEITGPPIVQGPLPVSPRLATR